MIPILLVLSVLSLQPFTAPWCYHISPSFFLFKSLRLSQFSPSKPPRFSSHIFRQMPSLLCEGEWHSPTLWGRGWSVATCKIVWNNWDSFKISSLQTLCCSTTFHSSPQMRLSISLQALFHMAWRKTQNMESCFQLCYFRDLWELPKLISPPKSAYPSYPLTCILQVCLQDHRIAETGGSSGDQLVHPLCSWQAQLPAFENSPVGLWIISEEGDSTASLATSSSVQTPLQ